MDTTLRDGEQTWGVSFAAQEKLSIAQAAIVELGIDRIEIASARVSAGEMECVKRVAAWAERLGYLERLEVLGFIDGGRSLEWIREAGCRTVNLLCKGSYRHVTEQLRKTPDEHLDDIRREIDAACKMGLAVNVYLEDWSNGMQSSHEYVYHMVDELQYLPIRRIMLPDTLGILNPLEAYEYCKAMTSRYPAVHFDFHAHNDYDLAVANVYSAIIAGVKGIHTTINGLGERAGNAPLSSVLAVINDQLNRSTRLNEAKLNYVSRLVETYSGIRIAPNRPVIGEAVFTQCAGVHADGDSKSNLYYNDLLPERFGRVREYALGKLSGKANIRKNLEALGLDAGLDDDSIRKVTERVIELGDKKKILTQADLPYIVSDVLKGESAAEPSVRILNYSLSLTKDLHPVATLRIEINGEFYEQSASGDGQYDAFVKALRMIYAELGRPFPTLTDYAVTIPPGGHTDALVHTVIRWNLDGDEFKTSGLDGDQTEAAIQATIKMLNKIEK
jgi:D-citramalate synthase